MADEAASDLPGVDLGALTGWLDATCPGLRNGRLSGAVIAGGKSNLTYRITDGTSTWALRRPPLAHVLPTAHDMNREFRALTGLHDTDVPVATPIAICNDESVLGAKFYLMEFVEALVLDRSDTLETLSNADATRCCELLVDTLVTLHNVDPAAVGLDDFGRPEGFLARQLKRWHAQWQASETEPRPELDRLLERLSSELPQQAAPAIVHGDYRLTNVMFSADYTRIAAVVDWEMATLGDPLTDIGLLHVYQALSQRENYISPLMLPERGFLTPEQLVQRYIAASPRDVSRMGWYIAFAYFKLAVISEGINARYLAGKTVGAGFDQAGATVPILLRAGADALT